MPEAFKNHFNEAVITHLASQLWLNYPVFDQRAFIKQACAGLDSLELKARSNQICDALLAHMPRDFAQASEIIVNSLAPPGDDQTIVFEQSNKGTEDSPQGIAGWIMMPVSDYITQACLQSIDTPKHPNFALGLEALKACTQRYSAEFAIRPFLRDFSEATLTVLGAWVYDENAHVRRLVSEGTRPFLPWGLRLHHLADDPSLILPLLTHLRDDKSEYVRRSVANNLNDIAKPHPNLVARIARQWWQDGDKNRTRLIKHACRTLLKNGHPGALALFGYPPASLDKVSLALSAKQVAIGDLLEIVLSLSNPLKQMQNLLVDYAVYHQKANGTLSPKVFKWRSFELLPNERKTFCKAHSFKLVTTRKYYPGEHRIEILINGESQCEQVFELI